MENDLEDVDSEEDEGMDSTKDFSPPIRLQGPEDLSGTWPKAVATGGTFFRPIFTEKNPILENVKQNLKSHLKEKFTIIYEGTSAHQTNLEDVYTRLFITDTNEDCRSHEVLDQFKHPRKGSLVKEISSLNIFNPGRHDLHQRKRPTGTSIQMVMTKGIAGIGKTVAVQNFTLNWAEGKSNQHIDFIFVLPLRELNMLKEGEYTLMQLLLYFYPELSPLKDSQLLEKKQVLFIFDGLDESRFLLDFEGSMRMTQTEQQSTVNVLLVNLIKKNLLPDALLWITSRPAAVGQIPSEYIDQMTEVQGFTEQNKEEYVKKRFKSEDQAEEVLSRLRGMISFHFMGHIPIFCWIIAEVFKEGWSDQSSQRITTMTELYMYYLIIQTKRTTQKYGQKGQNLRSIEDPKMILNLSKLAFEQLQKGNIIFYEEDLKECGIDTDEVSVFCGFCSKILKQERGFYMNQVFSFVHLSFQEFLAALFVFYCCLTKDVGALESFLEVEPAELGLLELQKRVVDKAMKSETGQLDLFLCFFLGFSLESNQMMLQSLLPLTKTSSESSEEIKKYLRNFNVGNIPKERCINLFLCKFELKEEKIQKDINEYLKAGVSLSPMDCSVVCTMLEISQEPIEELDISKSFAYLPELERLAMLMKKCRKAVLVTEQLIGDILISILESSDSCLRELHLLYHFNSTCLHTPSVSYDLLQVLRHSRCKLETLRLPGFHLDFKQCHMLASVLQSQKTSLRALDLTNCSYSYGQNYSRHLSEAVEEKEEYEDFIDELSLLTFIPAGLIGPFCKLEQFSMPGCHLTDKCCQVFASALSSNTRLRELDLSRNNIQDLGVLLLSTGLGSQKCRLEILRLSHCGITEEGCASLASALRSNPSHLRELDVSYNYPGEAGVRLLSERLEDPDCQLEKLSIDHDEELWINPQLLSKYACDLTLDPKSKYQDLCTSDFKKKFSIHKDPNSKFPLLLLVMCSQALTGRAYWEVEWEGFVSIGAAYQSLKSSLAFMHVRSDKSWLCTVLSDEGYSFYHEHRDAFFPVHLSPKAFLTKKRRLGLFLDWSAGVLCFYALSGDTKTHLHTYNTTFTEPLYPVFVTHGIASFTIASEVTPTIDDAKSSFTPEVVRERLGISYRFRFPSSGLFECSLTRLVFSVTHEGEVTYKTLIWDSKILDPASKVPRGPLFSIKCPQSSICQLHLPHCEPEPGLVSECLAVVHLTDDSMNIIQPLEITESHVVVETPNLSSFGIILDVFKRVKGLKRTSVRGQVLLFSRPAPRKHLILSVILLPSNVPLLEVQEQYENCKYIPAPSNCQLYKKQLYSLHSDPEGFTIQPPHAPFIENYGPNYHATFEVNLPMNTKEVTLLVQDPKMIPVWKHGLYLPDPSNETHLEIYPVTRESMRSRVALLITNIEFTDKEYNRNGADKDERNMEKQLTRLGYEVVKHRNLTAQDIDDALISFSKHPKLKKTDSVVVVIMSHGERGVIHGVDRKEEKPDEFPIDNIYKLLGPKDCPALQDKPKIIIIQACRGEEEGSVEVSDAADSELVQDDVRSPSAAEEDTLKFVHREKDFISLLSSTPDTVSYRRPEEGSILILNLNKVLNTFAHKEEIVVLFRRVMELFEDFSIGSKMQMPTIDRCTLTRAFFFFPGL